MRQSVTDRATRMSHPRQATHRSLVAGIRFQIDKLTHQNAHHEFEHLCRQYARARISSNILPATGPVAAGGDQGRDFETFRRFVRDRRAGTSYFLGAGESKPLVFACSLVAHDRLRAKIKDDVETICATAVPHAIYFFSNQSLPVAKRHSVQTWCSETHDCHLEVLDAEALAEALAEPTLFWIAEEYLHVPADLYPRPDADDGYRALWDRWLAEPRQPSNFADYVELKSGLRAARFEERLAPDIAGWIRAMERFLSDATDPELRRRAVYEVCIAALRGLHNLDAKRHLVEEYFERWASITDPAVLRDTAILLSYCSSAVIHGEFDFPVERLHAYSKALLPTLMKEIKRAPGPNSLADLLYTRSTVAQLPFLRGTTPFLDKADILRWWSKTLAAARKSSLFPVEQFADLLTVATEIFGDDAACQQVARQTDELLEKRSSGYAAASKSRDRALAHVEAGNRLAAIDELHRAQVKWFTAETLRGTLLAMLALVSAYRDLGLVWAAKYHALGAAFLIARSQDDEIKDMFVGALVH